MSIHEEREALKLLMNYITEYSTGLRFSFHTEFVKELSEIITKNAAGREKEIFQILVKQLGYVKLMGTRVNEADSNEILHGFGNGRSFYSLHIQNRIVNIRLLIAFKSEEAPCFLAAFNEKSGKRVTDYSRWEKIVEERYLQLEE